MEITITTPEGDKYNGKIKVPLLATVGWVDQVVLAIYLDYSKKHGFISFGKPFDKNTYQCDYSWNYNDFGLDVENNPETPAIQYFDQESPVLLVQIGKKDTRYGTVPQGNLDDHDFILVENEHIAIDRNGKERIVHMPGDNHQFEFCKTCIDDFDFFFEHPFRGLLCKESRAERQKRWAANKTEQRNNARHKCAHKKFVNMEELMAMTEDSENVIVMPAQFYHCMMTQCLPLDEEWLKGARLIDFDKKKVLVPMSNYRIILGLLVIDVETKHLSVYRMEGTERTFIDAHRHDIFTLTLKYIAREMALINHHTAFRADSWRQSEHTLRVSGTQFFSLCGLVHRISTNTHLVYCSTLYLTTKYDTCSYICVIL